MNISHNTYITYKMYFVVYIYMYMYISIFFIVIFKIRFIPKHCALCKNYVILRFKYSYFYFISALNVSTNFNCFSIELKIVSAMIKYVMIVSLKQHKLLKKLLNV